MPSLLAFCPLLLATAAAGTRGLVPCTSALRMLSLEACYRYSRLVR